VDHRPRPRDRPRRRLHSRPPLTGSTSAAEAHAADEGNASHSVDATRAKPTSAVVSRPARATRRIGRMRPRWGTVNDNVSDPLSCPQPGRCCPTCRRSSVEAYRTPRCRFSALKEHRIPAQGANPGNPPGKTNQRSEGTPHNRVPPTSSPPSAFISFLSLLSYPFTPQISSLLPSPFLCGVPSEHIYSPICGADREMQTIREPRPFSVDFH
jgi:hypothetical protein